MYTPMGFVTATIAAKKTVICSQPMVVMGQGSSEAFGTDQGVDEVRAQQQRKQGADSVVEVHGLSPLDSIEGHGIEPADDEEGGGDGDQDQVFHGDPSLSITRARALEPSEPTVGAHLRSLAVAEEQLDSAAILPIAGPFALEATRAATRGSSVQRRRAPTYRVAIEPSLANAFASAFRLASHFVARAALGPRASASERTLLFRRESATSCPERVSNCTKAAFAFVRAGCVTGTTRASSLDRASWAETRRPAMSFSRLSILGSAASAM